MKSGALIIIKGFAIFRLSPMQAYEVFRRKINTLCYRKSSKQKKLGNPGASPEEFSRLKTNHSVVQETLKGSNNSIELTHTNPDPDRVQ